MSTFVQSITVEGRTLPDGQFLLYDAQSGAGIVFPSAADAASQFTVPANSFAAMEILLKLLVAQNAIDGNPIASVMGKTITLTLTSSAQPGLTVNPTP